MSLSANGHEAVWHGADVTDCSNLPDSSKIIKYDLKLGLHEKYQIDNRCLLKET